MAKLLEIKLCPDPVLRQKTKEIKPQHIKDPEIQRLVLDMGKTMVEKDGVGLAAPQVGLGIKLVVILTKEGVLTLFNPRIAKRSWKKNMDEEGCLSVPGIYGIVRRNHKVKVRAFNQEGKKITIDAEGFFARVLQHEIDHLDGILFIDKVKEITKGKDKLGKFKSS